LIRLFKGSRRFRWLRFRCFCGYIGNQFFPKPLGAAEEREHVKRMENGDRESRNILIERNLRLVAHIGKKYEQCAIDKDDLISIGIIGLIKAIDSFSSDRNVRLATYASRCIENEILMALRAGKNAGQEMSLYEPLGRDKEGNEVSLLDILEEDGVNIADQVGMEENVRLLYETMERVLSDREKEVLTLRYGLNGEDELPQRVIAARLGISRSYVSRIQKTAVAKLAKAFADRGYES
jgi:RNA polymerase sporulation-specific sigma factor